MSTWILLLITSLSIVNADEQYTEEGRAVAWIIVICCVVAVCVIGGIAGIVFLMKNRGSNQVIVMH